MTDKDEIIGQIVEGKVTNITNFGAFLKLQDGQDGLIHISEIADEFVNDISKFVNINDEVKVKVLSRNAKGKLELSLKQITKEEQDKKPIRLKAKEQNNGFEEIVNKFMKRSEEKQIDIRRNIKHKQGIQKKRNRKAVN